MNGGGSETGFVFENLGRPPGSGQQLIAHFFVGQPMDKVTHESRFSRAGIASKDEELAIGISGEQLQQLQDFRLLFVQAHR
jgi:hypothetical protein